MKDHRESAKSMEAKDVPPPVALDRCPACRYSLQGLPTAHRCPECGFLYDEQTRVWRAKSFWKFGGIMLIVAVSQGPQALGRLREKSPQHWLFWLNVALIILWTCVLIRLIIRYRAHPFVAVGPGGVTYKTDKSTAAIVPWDEVVAVDLGPPGKFKHVQLKTKSSTKPIDLKSIIFSQEVANEFRQSVEARMFGPSATEST